MELSDRAKKVFLDDENINWGSFAKLLPLWRGSGTSRNGNFEDKMALGEVCSELIKRKIGILGEEGYTIDCTKIPLVYVERFFNEFRFTKERGANNLANALREENKGTYYAVYKTK